MLMRLEYSYLTYIRMPDCQSEKHQEIFMPYPPLPPTPNPINNGEIVLSKAYIHACCPGGL